MGEKRHEFAQRIDDLQQRYYDPLAARFLSIDPITTDQKTGDLFNRYIYGRNNPYRYTDPDGRAPGPLIEVEEGGRSAEPIGARGMDGGPVRFSIGGARANLSEARAQAALRESAKGPEGVRTPVEKTPSGKRVGDFTKSQKDAAKTENAAANSGEMKCTDCGREVQSIKSEKGVPTPANQAQVHHDPAIKDGGGQQSKPVVVCPECHKTRHGQ